MALVITIAQQKGGAGKTMLAANLAAALAPARRVGVLDTDPQRSLTRWHALARGQAGMPGVGFAEVSGWRLQATLDDMGRTHDVLVVDSPPHVDTDSRRAVRMADLVLVPVQPSAPDLWAAEGTLALAAFEKRRAVLVVNRAPTVPTLRTAALVAVRQSGHTVLPAVLGNRSIFAQAFAQGLGVLELAPRTVAAREMRALLDAVLGILA